MQALIQDLRYGVRMLVKQPGFALIAVVTIALGIGANTAVFTVVNATLAHGLPYRAPEQLVHLWERTPQQDFPRREASYPDYLDWKQSQSLSGVAAYTGCQMILNREAAQEPIPCARVSANFFALLGVEPALGRLFQNEEDQPGGAQAVLITYNAWQQRFGGDPKLIGQTLRISDAHWTVIGVLPPSFHFAPRGGTEFWAPLVPDENRRNRRGMHWVKVIGRLKGDAAPAQAELRTIGQRIAGQFPDSHANTSIFLEPLQQEVIGSVKPLMFALLGAVVLVLLIACANVANLLLVRAASRQKELAIRLTLGATRATIVRQLLNESLLLALIGGALGVLLARWGVGALVAAIPEVILRGMPYLHGLALDGRVLAFTSSLTILTGIVFGLAPALQASKPTVQPALKEGGRSSAGGSKRLQQALVVSEIALALVLLIGAGLMVKSALRLLQFNPGFNPEKLLLMSFTLTDTARGQKYETPEARAAFHQQLLAQTATVPGVRGVATIDVVPLTGGNTSRGYAAGRAIPPPDEQTEFNYRTISENYFGVMEIPLLQGRHFTAQDNTQTPSVIIVNQTLAQRMFPGESALGQRIVNSPTEIYEIVGVVGDERINGLTTPIKPVVYRPFLQEPDSAAVLLVRTADDPLKLTESLRRTAQGVEPSLVIFFTRSLENLAANLPATFMRRYTALLLGAFAGLALLLAAIGIYGVMSYSVTQRTQEIGIRVALGAQVLDVLRLVMGQGMKLALAGIVLGLMAALGLTRLLASLLFGVSASDPLTFASVALLLASVALLACWLPARRATKVDPMTALRCE